MSPEKRCLIVANRLELFRSNGQLRYLRPGKVNSQPVICVTQYIDGSCSSGNILVTLQQEDDPNQILKKLIDAGNEAGVSGIYLSPPKETIEPFIQEDGFLSIDIQDLIDFRAGKKIPVFPQN